MISKNNKKYFTNAKWTADEVRIEITRGLALLNKIDKPIVTILGSHKPTGRDEYYRHAEKLAYALGRRGFAIVTGGGTGIMSAANKGASRAKAPSIGIMASLLQEEHVRKSSFTHYLSYHFLFVRRFILSIKSDYLVFYPGGYGTLNELFEYIVLIQLGMMDQVPVICIGRKYWKGLFKWLHTMPRKKGYFINSKRDLRLVRFADTTEELLAIIENKT